MLLTFSIAFAAAQSGPVLYEVDGHMPGHGLGTSLAGVPDVTGDGVPDLLAGGFRYGSWGRPVLIDGATGSVMHQFVGPNFGETVAPAGDVDADGYEDFLFGDIFASHLPPLGGKAWVFSGKAPHDLLYEFGGTIADQYLGGAACGLGDINGDGHGDFAIGSWGAPTTQPFAGRVDVHSGADGAVLYTIEGTFDHGYLGDALDAVPDVDGDGVMELVIGAVGETFPYGYNTGAVYLHSGATGALLQHWTGVSGNARMGTAVAGVRDLDGDGTGEVLVSAMFAGLNGEAYVYSGATGAQLFEFRGYDPTEVFGIDVDSSADSNGDGVDDLIIGSDAFYNVNGITGKVRVYSGADGRLLQDFRAGGPAARLGLGVASLGDVNGDGRGDYAAGAATIDTAAGADAGRVYVFSGKREGLVLEIASLVAGGAPVEAHLSGCAPSSQAVFGWSLTGAGPSSSPLGPIALSPPVQRTAPVPCQPDGSASLTLGALPPSALGLPVWAQAAELFAAGGGRLSLGLSLRVQ
ncbi:MAG: hypothetical protein CMJ94_09460 [Planctomycetes bacterium]|nr:hypothetical protein [Planctomycetota bacterium]